jgi:predicted acyltransferase
MTRHASIDLVRGVAILLMVLSGVIPYKVLPAWMYHAQLPPPGHVFTPTLPGITWVDLVFPMFLFTMGVAIPFALRRRIEEGMGAARIHGELAKRALLLAAFAIFLQHVRPYTLDPSPGTAVWLIALAGFATLWLGFGRFRNAYLNLAALLPAGLILHILLNRYTEIGFDPGRSDIILLVLANMAFFGGVAWYWTRDRLDARLGVMAVVGALVLSSQTDGWVKTGFDGFTGLWILKLPFWKYLLIVIPGTILGDWLSSSEASGRRVSGPTALAGLIIPLVGVVGLHQRWVFGTTVLIAVLITALWYREGRSRHPMLVWAVFWLALGLALEPFQGGVKKDPSTFSYYFLTAGLTIWIWFGLKWLEENRVWTSARDFIALNGQNPMVAYVGFMNLLYPLLALTGLAELIAAHTAHPWVGALRGLAYTLIVAWITTWMARRGWIWRT